MCGRYALKSELRLIADKFRAQSHIELVPRYNIAPSQPVSVVRQRETDERALDLVSWGLIPFWANQEDVPRIGNRMINARAETAGEKPSFRAPMKYRRCLIPADGFYEWKKLDGGRKQPMYVLMADEQLFAFAGLYEHWQSKQDGSEIVTCTILTTCANELMAQIHDRMPAIVDESDYDRWLDPGLQDVGEVAPILRSYPAELMMSRPVSTYVNNPRNEGVACLEPV